VYGLVVIDEKWSTVRRWILYRPYSLLSRCSVQPLSDNDRLGLLFTLVLILLANIFIREVSEGVECTVLN